MVSKFAKAKNFFEKDVIVYSILTVLLFLSCFFEAFTIAILGFVLIVSVFNNFDRNLKLILFTFPFQVLFKHLL